MSSQHYEMAIEGKVIDHSLDSGRIQIATDDGFGTWLEDELKDFEGKRVRVTLRVEEIDES